MPSLVHITDPNKMVMEYLKWIDETSYNNLFRGGVSLIQFEVGQQHHNTMFKPANGGGVYAKQKKYWWSLSELDNPCDFSMYGKWFPQDYPPVDPASPDDRALWDAAAVYGKILHTRIQNALINTNLVSSHLEKGELTSEYWLSDLVSREMRQKMIDLKITGRASDAPNNYLGIPIEIKGIADKDFDPSSRYFIDKAKPAQTQLTMYFLGVEKTRFICINRDKFVAGSQPISDQYLEFDMSIDVGFIDETLRRIEYLNRAIAKRQEAQATPRSCIICSILPYCEVGTRYMAKRTKEMAKH